jgi:hypothetical protein
MKYFLMMSLLICSTVFASSTAKTTPDMAQKRFALRKTKSIEITGKRIEHLKLMKSCIEKTNNKDELKKCHEAHKQVTQKMQADKKAVRQARKKEREAKRAAKKAAKK